MITAGAKCLFVLLIIAAATPRGTIAQAGGTIGGSVHVSHTSPLPGVMVTAISDASLKKSQPVTTRADGSYDLPSLEVGVYTVEFVREGFVTNRKRGVVVIAGQRTVADVSDMKLKLPSSTARLNVKGIVTRRDSDGFDVEDANGDVTTIALADRTSIKTKGGFFGGSSTYGATNILPGLNLEVEARGDSSGRLVADKIRFGEADLRVVQSIQARVDPVESRVGNAEGRIDQVEANSQRLSGQLDELAAVSNAARGGAKAAQESADAAISGVNATNERISALDDYTAQQSVNVNFKVASSVLTPEAKSALDQIAQQALKARGYVIEVRGFASADGGEEANRRLSQRRADAVVRYLAETHNIPLRRIITPFGYGEKQAIADNATRQGREQNRRVQVNVLINRGITAPTPQTNPVTPPPKE